jgi:hypothetical protein
MSDGDRKTLRELVEFPTEEDPAGVFSWNDGAVAAFHGAAAALPVLVAIPPFPISMTPAGFKTALLGYLAAMSGPGALMIDGGTLGITCVRAAGLGRLTGAMMGLSLSAWVRQVLAAAPLAAPLATLYTGASGAAGKDGGFERVYPLVGLPVGQPALFA